MSSGGVGSCAAAWQLRHCGFLCSCTGCGCGSCVEFRPPPVYRWQSRLSERSPCALRRCFLDDSGGLWRDCPLFRPWDPGGEHRFLDQVPHTVSRWRCGLVIAGTSWLYVGVFWDFGSGGALRSASLALCSRPWPPLFLALVKFDAWELCEAMKRPHYASQAEATPRVDVGEVSQAPGDKAARSFKDQNPCIKGGSNKRCFFVIDLSGKTWTMTTALNSSTSSLQHDISSITGIPVDWFGRLDPDLSLNQNGIDKDVSVRMSFRLKGGVRQEVPGSWTCNICNMGGCWPVRQNCFRCGAARGSGPSGPTGREKKYPGRNANTSGGGGNPSVRRQQSQPRPVGPQPSPAATMPQHSSFKLDASTVLQLLQSMGLGQDLLTQVEAKLSPPPKKEPGPEKRLTTLKGKILMCQQQLVKLRKQCDSAVKTFLELEQKFIAKEKEQHEYSQEYNNIKENMKLTPTPSEKGAEDILIEPIQEDEDLTPVMKVK